MFFHQGVRSGIGVGLRQLCPLTPPSCLVSARPHGARAISSFVSSACTRAASVASRQLSTKLPGTSRASGYALIFGPGLLTVGVGFGLQPWHLGGPIRAEELPRLDTKSFSAEKDLAKSSVTGGASPKEGPTNGEAPSSKGDDADAVPLTAQNDSQDIELSQLKLVKRGSKLVSLVAWCFAMACWTSLVWLPVATIVLGTRLMRGGSSTSLYSTAVILASLYTWPLLPGSSSPHQPFQHGFMGPYLLNWFSSAEVWADQAALSRTAEEPTMFCYHPHGVFSVGLGALVGAGRSVIPEDLVVFSAPFIKFCGPLLQVFARISFGPSVRIESAGKDSLHRVFRSRASSVLLVPGGIQEATLSAPGKERLFLQRRKGFVKYALQHGYSLTPVYAFGENDVYGNAQMGMSWRLRLNEGVLGCPQGLPTVLPFGWRWLPLLPRPNAPLRVVIGPPLRLPHIKNPSREEVEVWHSAYVAAVRRLYDSTAEGPIVRAARPLEIL
eukprot:TRINITY_DN54508_c0_g1_i1.p1 TRINITY_DN54508_c0_g1~~TRINITY_DN54508_c0_g1_i1.p1  ORF type:complete len:497 (-),score=55.78 TRINITY_DN54508_c0_g1_i1:111-1601(-)